MDKLFFMLLFLFCITIGNAQIKEVSFQLQFDKNKNVFYCYMIVNKGDAYSKKNRIQYNSQLTIVTPKNCELKMVESFAPLQDNALLNGVKPLKWYIGNELKDVSTIHHSNIYSLLPSVSPTAYYNHLDENSVVKLFSFSVSPLPACIKGIRLFDNVSDIGIPANESKGGDFKNTISIGGLHSIISSNRSIINPLLPLGTTQSKYKTHSSSDLQLKAGDWENATNFTWITPDGKTLAVKDPIIRKVQPNQSGLYKLIVTSNDGCSLENEVNVEIKDIPMEALSVVEKPDQNLDYDARLRSLGSIETMIYPNPAKDHLIIRIKHANQQKYKIDILDINGKVVRESVSSASISTEDHLGTLRFDLNSGLYMLRLTIEQKTIEHNFFVLE